MADKQQYAREDAVDTPARKAATLTPHDSAEIDPLPKQLLIAAAGNVVLRAVDSSSDVTITGAAVGTVIPIRAKLVKATGTTATVIALA